MSTRKLDGESDTEDILSLIESRDDTEHFEEINNADQLQLVLRPPNQGNNSDKDDTSCDCEESSANLQDIGRGIRAEKGEIRADSKAGFEVLDVDKKMTPSSAKWHCSCTKISLHN